MTLPRLTALAILLFCGTMTTLLVRSVYWPEDSALASVAPQVPVEMFLRRTEGSSLDVWEGNQITGNLYLTPASSPRRADGAKGGRVRLDATLLLKPNALEARHLVLQGLCFLHAEGEVDDLELDLILHTLPEVRLSVKQPAGDRWPSLKLTRGGETLFSSKGGQVPDEANSRLLQMLTAAAGLSPESLLAPSAKKGAGPVVRAGKISAGGEEFDGYCFTMGEGEEGFRLYFANTGEVLRIETPFSVGSQLGLRFLSQSLRPRGTEVPDLNPYPSAGKKP